MAIRPRLDMVKASVRLAVGGAMSSLGYIAGAFIQNNAVAVGNTQLASLPLPIVVAALVFAGVALYDLEDLWDEAKDDEAKDAASK